MTFNHKITRSFMYSVTLSDDKNSREPVASVIIRRRIWVLEAPFSPNGLS
jgi:hypothetical protein